MTEMDTGSVIKQVVSKIYKLQAIQEVIRWELSRLEMLEQPKETIDATRKKLSDMICYSSGEEMTSIIQVTSQSIIPPTPSNVHWIEVPTCAYASYAPYFDCLESNHNTLQAYTLTKHITVSAYTTKGKASSLHVAPSISALPGVLLLLLLLAGHSETIDGIFETCQILRNISATNIRLLGDGERVLPVEMDNMSMHPFEYLDVFESIIESDDKENKGDTQALRDDTKAEVIASEAHRLLLLYSSGKSDDAGDELHWTQSINKNGVVVSSSPVRNSTWLAILATTVIECSAEVARDYITDDTTLHLYDDMFDSFEFIEQVDDKTSIRRMKYKPVWPTSPRDFIVCTTWFPSDNGYLLCSKSASDEYYAKKKNYVRGNIIIAGYVIKRRDNGGCDLSLIAHTELGGTLPSTIVNMYSSNAPYNMLNALSALLKNKEG